jgi:hypothetical protein
MRGKILLPVLPDESVILNGELTATGLMIGFPSRQRTVELVAVTRSSRLTAKPY